MIILNAVNHTENFLSDIAPIPIIGRAAGVVRVCLGVIQTITALALAILLTLPALIIKGVRHSWSDCFTQSLHGIENIVAGTLEIIPFVGGMF